MKSKTSVFLAVAGFVFCVGCETVPKGIGDPYFANVRSKANVYARQAQAGVVKIAVMPFKASTELIGSSVSDIVVTELLRTQMYQLVERGQMNQVLSETELAMAGLSEAKAVEAAKMLGAESVVIGTVDEYGQQAKGGDTYAVVGLAIRLIDCSSGKIVWSADLAKMAKDDDTSLPKHARDVVHELVSGLYQNLTGQEGSLPPPTPMDVSVSDMGLREATVRWTLPKFPAKYRIERSDDERGPFASVGEANASGGKFVDKSGLKDSSTYYYRVVGVGRTGSLGEPSPVVETMTAPPPNEPTGIAAVALSSRCIRVSWQAPESEGVSGYRVERSPFGSEAWKAVGKPVGTTFVDGGKRGCDLADSTRYRYRVIAVNRVGSTSVASAEADAETPPPPAAVRDFAAKSNGIRCVPLTWCMSDEEDVDSYEIERAEESGPFRRLAKVPRRSATSHMDGGNEPGTLPDLRSYRYRIRSCNTVGAVSEWSSAEATTKPKPSTPSGLEATRDEPGVVLLKWQANPECDIVEYRVESRSPQGWFWRKLATTGACQAQESGLKPSEAKVFRVMAVGPKNHQSDWSAECTGSARALPPAPTGLRAVRCDGGYKISFTPPPGGMPSFKVYRKKFIGSEFLKAVGEPEAVVPMPAPGGADDIVVTSVDERGLESLPSEKVTIRD